MVFSKDRFFKGYPTGRTSVSNNMVATTSGFYKVNALTGQCLTEHQPIVNDSVFERAAAANYTYGQPALADDEYGQVTVSTECDREHDAESQYEYESISPKWSNNVATCSSKPLNR